MKLWIGLLLASLVSFYTNAAKTINLTNGEWAPYLSERLPENGFVSAVVREAYKAVGMEVNYGFFPWKRALYYAKQGKSDGGEQWDGSVVWFYTEERTKSFYYSNPVLSEDGVLYHLKSNPIQWETVEDLQGMVIGGTAHTLYPLFEAAEKKNIIQLERAGGYEALFDRLLAKRIDAIPNIRGVAEYYLHTNYPKEVREQVTFSPTVFETRVYHLILNKVNPENKKNLKLFEQGMRLIKENGTYERLLVKLEQGFYYK